MERTQGAVAQGASRGQGCCAAEAAAERSAGGGGEGLGAPGFSPAAPGT